MKSLDTYRNEKWKESAKNEKGIWKKAGLVKEKGRQSYLSPMLAEEKNGLAPNHIASLGNWLKETELKSK